MRHLPIVLLTALLVLAGATGAVWINRIPIAEWAIATYQPESPFGPVDVRIADITPSSINISEIKARFRGSLSIHDVNIGFSLFQDGAPTLNPVILGPIQIGSLNADLSFADWKDVSNAFATENTSSGGPTVLPFAIHDVTVETIDLYAETPKGYALVNGALKLADEVDFSTPSSLAALIENLEGNLLLSAGGADFPLHDGVAAAGSLVLSTQFGGVVAGVEAVTPSRINLTLVHPPGDVLGMPLEKLSGIYRLELGTDETPFNIALRYGVREAKPAILALSPSAFPFFLDTPFGTAEAKALADPVDLTETAVDPMGVPVRLSGHVDLSGVPLPHALVAEAKGAFSVERHSGTDLTLRKGFSIAADISNSDILAALPEDLRGLVGPVISAKAKSDFVARYKADPTGLSVTGQGSLEAESKAAAIKLPSGFYVSVPNGGAIQAAAKTLSAFINPKRANRNRGNQNNRKPILPHPLNATFNEISAALSPDGDLRITSGYGLKMGPLQTKGLVQANKRGDRSVLKISDASLALSDPKVSLPNFSAAVKTKGAVFDINADVASVIMDETAALKAPTKISATVVMPQSGSASDAAQNNLTFKGTAHVGSDIKISVNGTSEEEGYAVTFMTNEVPLGPGGVELTMLTDFFDPGSKRPKGRIQVVGSAKYHNGVPSGYADLFIAEVGSTLGDGAEISVLGDIRFDLSKPPATLRPATLKGTLKTDLLGTLTFEETFTLRETGEMDVLSLKTEFLGGTIEVSEGLGNPTAGSLEGLLRARRIDLEALATLLNIEGLESTGRLTGDLGFTVSEEAITVQAGSLKTNEPGILRYQGDALRNAAAGDENLALLVKALENFHYEILTLGIDIPEFGEGLVTLHLEGNNPDVLDGYPFDVTINLESEYGRLIKTFLSLYREVDVILKGALR